MLIGRLKLAGVVDQLLGVLRQPRSQRVLMVERRTDLTHNQHALLRSLDDFIHGYQCLLRPHHAGTRSGIGRSYQRTTVFPNFSVLENCRLAAQAARQRPWALWESAARCNDSVGIAQEALAAAGLSGTGSLPAGSMSHGKKRQLEIATCLTSRPQVLLPDEPLAGMGAEETERMLRLLENLRQTHAILLVEHDMDAVFRIADRITVMVNGQTIASDVPQAIRTNTEVQIAYLGDAHA